MEFDNTPSTISDEARRQAEAKQVTLQPLHGDVAPEAISDTEIAARHVNGEPIANIPDDTEETNRPAQSVQPTAPSRKRHGGAIAAVVVIVCGLAAGAAVYVLN